MRRQTQENVLRRLTEYQNSIQLQFPGSQEIYAFPLNLSYLTMRQIWQQIKITDIQVIGDEESELSLSTAVISYPGKVFSVWVFFGVIKKR
jgi:hypothetical protein